MITISFYLNIEILSVKMSRVNKALSTKKNIVGYLQTIKITWLKILKLCRHLIQLILPIFELTGDDIFLGHLLANHV